MLEQRNLIDVLVIQHPLHHNGIDNVSQLTRDTSNSDDSSTVTTYSINEMHKPFLGSPMDALSQDAVNDVLPPRIPNKQRSTKSLLPFTPDLEDTTLVNGNQRVRELLPEENSKKTEKIQNKIECSCFTSTDEEARCELKRDTDGLLSAFSAAEKDTHTENLMRAHNDREAKRNNEKINSKKSKITDSDRETQSNKKKIKKKEKKKIVRQRQATDPLRHSAGPRMEFISSSLFDKPPRMAQRRASCGNGN